MKSYNPRNRGMRVTIETSSEDSLSIGEGGEQIGVSNTIFLIKKQTLSLTFERMNGKQRS